MEALILYWIAYVFLAIFLVFPPSEFISAGLTLHNFLSPIIGSESDLPQVYGGKGGFVWYHIRRSSATLIVHFFLPLGISTI